MKKSTSPTRTAFSLVELSIVLVILGLLVGGVLIGRNLIRAAELRSVMTDANAYITAAANFRQQYRFLPGDASNAESYWSAASTDNGNADGVVTGAERFLAWQHLNLAGFVEKSFTGLQGAGGAEDFVLGSNAPVARIPLTGFGFYYNTTAAATATEFAANMGNAFSYGQAGAANSGAPRTAILTATDAFSMDTKMDDGRPGTGKWVATSIGGGNFGATTGCASANTAAATYNVALPTPNCSFYIMSGY
jgi:prepilin-type N-terminal cleavage/methylation domain-containing protein